MPGRGLLGAGETHRLRRVSQHPAPPSQPAPASPPASDSPDPEAPAEVPGDSPAEAPEVAAQRRHTDAAHNAGFSGRSNLDKALIGAGVAAAVAIPAAMVAAKILQRDGEAAQ